MEENKQTAFICDLYNKYSPDKIIKIFKLNGRWWAIKEVYLEWGVPQLQSIEDDNPMSFRIYNTLEEAEQYIRKLKQLEGVRF